MHIRRRDRTKMTARGIRQRWTEWQVVREDGFIYWRHISQEAAQADLERREARAHAEWLTSDEGLEAQADMATERATRNALSYDQEAIDAMEAGR